MLALLASLFCLSVCSSVSVCLAGWLARALPHSLASSEPQLQDHCGGEPLSRQPGTGLPRHPRLSPGRVRGWFSGRGRCHLQTRCPRRPCDRQGLLGDRVRQVYQMPPDHTGAASHFCKLLRVYFPSRVDTACCISSPIIFCFSPLSPSSLLFFHFFHFLSAFLLFSLHCILSLVFLLCFFPLLGFPPFIATALIPDSLI